MQTTGKSTDHHGPLTGAELRADTREGGALSLVPSALCSSFGKTLLSPQPSFGYKRVMNYEDPGPSCKHSY